MLRETNPRWMTGRGPAARVLVLLVSLLMMSATGCMTEQVAGRNDYIPEHHMAEQTVARRDLGIEYLSNGRVAMALRELLAAYDFDPEDPVTLLWLGEGYRRRGHDDLALEYMKLALEIEPDYQAAHLNLSGFYLQNEEWEKSIEHSQYLVDDPLFEKPQFAWSNKGWALYKLGRLAEARKSFVWALRLQRSYWPADLNLGILEDSAGREEQALRHFERVLRQRISISAGSEANFRLAKVHVGMGNRAEAIEHFMASVEGDPAGDWAEQSREFLEMLE
jgi:type IV pilus assembly protein PilF